VLADHHVVFSEGLGMLLDAEDDLVVLGLAHHSRHAVDAIARYRPAVCILDAQLPDGDLAQTLATAKAASSTTRLLALTDAARVGGGADRPGRPALEFVPLAEAREVGDELQVPHQRVQVKQAPPSTRTASCRRPRRPSCTATTGSTTTP
jgi:chemotaxis response regulator CheB